MRHLFPTDRIAGLLDADRGLTAEEVEERRRLYGSNDILGDRNSGWGNIARDTARDPMVWLLVATAFLFAWLGDFIEASVLALALVPIAGMDAYLHRRTQATTEGLAGRLTTQARVLRDGGPRDILRLNSFLAISSLSMRASLSRPMACSLPALICKPTSPR